MDGGSRRQGDCRVERPAQWDKEHHQERYQAILSAADLVRFICPGYSRSCFQRRNEWMVDHAARVIAVWNGQPSGTKNTLDYARLQNVQVVSVER